MVQSETAENLFNSLETLLEREKLVVMKASFEEIDDIANEKTRLLDQLEKLSIEERAPLQALRHTALRNQALLESALSGIRDIAEKVALIRRVQSSLETYDKDGHKRAVYIASPGKLEKRA